MRKSKFTESQIVATLKQVEGGRQVKDMCRELGISEASNVPALTGIGCGGMTTPPTPEGSVTAC